MNWLAMQKGFRVAGGRQMPWLWLLVAAFMILVSMAFLDAPLAKWLYNRPEWLRAGFRIVNGLGKSDWYLWPGALVALAAGAACLRQRKTSSRRLLRWLSTAGAYLFLAVAIPGLLVNLIKITAGRARPKLLTTEGFYGFEPFNILPDFHSFPSGHSQTAFCAALALAAFWPSGRRALLILAGFVAAARMVLGAHFLSDVVTSALLSFIIIGWLERLCRDQKLIFTTGREGELRLRAEGRWWRRRVRKALCKQR